MKIVAYTVALHMNIHVNGCQTLEGCKKVGLFIKGVLINLGL